MNICLVGAVLLEQHEHGLLKDRRMVSVASRFPYPRGAARDGLRQILRRESSRAQTAETLYAHSISAMSRENGQSLRIDASKQNKGGAALSGAAAPYEKLFND